MGKLIMARYILKYTTKIGVESNSLYLNLSVQSEGAGTLISGSKY